MMILQTAWHQFNTKGIITRRMFNIVGERERPNLSAGCVRSHTNAFRPRERNALPLSLVFVSRIGRSTYLRAYSTAIYTRSVR